MYGCWRNFKTSDSKDSCSDECKKCKSGEALIGYRGDASDPGHVLVNIDPLNVDSKGLDCDGKLIADFIVLA